MSLVEIISRNPCTDEIVWRGPCATQTDIDTSVHLARQAFRTWSLTPLATRIDIITRYADVVRAQSEDFARIIADETGKPLWEARTEVATVAAKVDISIRAYHERCAHLSSENGAMLQTLRHKPHGLLAVLGPYNFPAHLPNGHIVPALLAGNVVLFKPSEQTPHTALFMASLWEKAGLPAHILHVIIGDGATGALLSSHDEIDGLLFTGSARTGFALNQQFAAKPNKILALEMGGNNPLVAWDVADADAAATLIVTSAFQTAGQRCTCARRLIVAQDASGDAILDAVIALTRKLTIGAQYDDPAPFMGCVISNSVADQLQAAWLGLEGNILLPLQRAMKDRPFLTPAIIDMTHARARVDEELFGPILQVIRVPDFDSALQEMNNTRFGLAAGLIGGDADLFQHFWASSRAGIINWNRPLTGASSAAPFGGVGASGNHRPSAYYAADYAAFPVAGLEQATLAAVDMAGMKK
jgi:succinylglutamic semialdehyde dehydrogenase